MDHLMSETATVKRIVETATDGAPRYVWTDVATVRCRLDLVFSRPGRDMLAPAVEAGRAPDRQGLCFAPVGSDIRSGDRLETSQGVFEALSTPDQVPGWSGAHHLEIPVREVAKSLTSGPSL